MLAISLDRKGYFEPKAGQAGRVCTLGSHSAVWLLWQLPGVRG